MQPIADYNAFFDGAIQALEESGAVKRELRDEKRAREEMELQLADMQDELSATIEKELRSRRAQISRTYDTEADQIEARLEDAHRRRSAAKSKGMKERITEETSQLHTENRNIRAQIAEDLRSRGLPDYCDGRLFNIIFMPEGAADHVLQMLIQLLCYAALPTCIVLISGTTNLWIVAAIFAADMLVFNAIYGSMLRSIVYKNYDILSAAAEKKAQIRDNTEHIEAIARDIKNDTNEEIYNLQTYDAEIEDIEHELDRVKTGRREALAEFDGVTSQSIADELTGNAQPRIDELSAQIADAAQRVTQLEADNRERNLRLTGDYEVYLGKEFMTRDRIEALRDIINHGTAANISEAKEEYEQRMEG